MSAHTRFMLTIGAVFAVVTAVIILTPMTAPRCPAGAVAKFGHYQWNCVVPALQ